MGEESSFKGREPEYSNIKGDKKILEQEGSNREGWEVRVAEG